MIQALIEKWKSWKLHHLLRTSGCETIEQYNHIYDPDINRRATTIPRFYFNYPYVVKIPEVYAESDFYIGVDILTQWCKQHCKGKWRHDWHRILYPDYWMEIDGYNINDIGGSDFVFFAFQSDRDYNWFILNHKFNEY